MVGPIVYLSGSMHQASGTNSKYASMPTAARPSNDLIFLTYTDAGTHGTLVLTRSYLAAGSNPQSDAQGFTSLAAISYPRNS